MSALGQSLMIHDSWVKLLHKLLKLSRWGSIGLFLLIWWFGFNWLSQSLNGLGLLFGAFWLFVIFLSMLLLFILWLQLFLLSLFNKFLWFIYHRLTQLTLKIMCTLLFHLFINLFFMFTYHFFMFSTLFRLLFIRCLFILFGRFCWFFRWGMMRLLLFSLCK